MTENNSEAAALAGATASETQMSAVVGTPNATSATAAPATPLVPPGGIAQADLDAILRALTALGMRLANLEKRVPNIGAEVAVLREQMGNWELARQEFHDHAHLARTDAIDKGARIELDELRRRMADAEEETRKLDRSLYLVQDDATDTGMLLDALAARVDAMNGGSHE